MLPDEDPNTTAEAPATEALILDQAASDAILTDPAGTRPEDVPIEGGVDPLPEEPAPETPIEAPAEAVSELPAFETTPEPWAWPGEPVEEVLPEGVNPDAIGFESGPAPEGGAAIEPAPLPADFSPVPDGPVPIMDTAPDAEEEPDLIETVVVEATANMVAVGNVADAFAEAQAEPLPDPLPVTAVSGEGADIVVQTGQPEDITSAGPQDVPTASPVEMDLTPQECVIRAAIGSFTWAAAHCTLGKTTKRAAWLGMKAMNFSDPAGRIILDNEDMLANDWYVV